MVEWHIGQFRKYAYDYRKYEDMLSTVLKEQKINS